MNLLKRFGQSIAMSQSVNSSLFEQIFFASCIPQCLTDKAGYIEKANHAFSMLTGYDVSQLLGKNIAFLYSDKNEESFFDRILNPLKQRKNFSGKLWNLHKDGKEYLHQVDIIEVEEKSQYYLFIHVDITEQIRMHERFRYLAHHDQLTGLANRILFEDRLEHALSNATRAGMKVGVIVLDINEFKILNHEFGHITGDSCLQETALRIKSACNGNDTVARFEGDEFSIMIEQLESINELDNICKKIAGSISDPLSECGVQLSASFGTAIFPHDGMNKDQLIKIAYEKVYRRKMEYYGIE